MSSEMNDCGLKTAVSGGTLMLDVPAYRSFGPASVGGDIVPVGPEALSPQDLLQLGELLPNPAGRPSLDPVHDLGREKEVDVIGLHAQLEDFEPVVLGAQTDHLFETLPEPTGQDPLAVLGDPDEVVLEVVSGVGRGTEHGGSIAKASSAGADGRLSSPALKDRGFQSPCE